MKRTYFSRSMATAFSALTVVIALSMSSCIDPNYYPAASDKPLGVNNNGANYKQDLEKAITNSDRIVVLQHSHASDFKGIITDQSKAPYYSYGSSVLSSSAKSEFLARVRRLTAYNSRPSNREFTSHHTIKFYSLGRLKSTMRVSLDINEVRWNGSRHTASQDIMTAVAPVIKNAGFITSRDWNGIARIEYISGRRTAGGSVGPVGNPNVTLPATSPPVTSPPVSPSVPTAKKVPGKPGMVFNPFTNNHVDVNGIPSGTKVRDPNDSNQAHIFRVP